MTTKGWILGMVLFIIISSFIKNYLTHLQTQNNDFYER